MVDNNTQTVNFCKTLEKNLTYCNYVKKVKIQKIAIIIAWILFTAIILEK